MTRRKKVKFYQEEFGFETQKKMEFSVALDSLSYRSHRKCVPPTTWSYRTHFTLEPDRILTDEEHARGISFCLLFDNNAKNVDTIVKKLFVRKVIGTKFWVYPHRQYIVVSPIMGFTAFGERRSSFYGRKKFMQHIISVELDNVVKIPVHAVYDSCKKMDRILGCATCPWSKKPIFCADHSVEQYLQENEKCGPERLFPSPAFPRFSWDAIVEQCRNESSMTFVPPHLLDGNEMLIGHRVRTFQGMARNSFALTYVAKRRYSQRSSLAAETVRYKKICKTDCVLYDGCSAAQSKGCGWLIRRCRARNTDHGPSGIHSPYTEETVNRAFDRFWKACLMPVAFPLAERLSFIALNSGVETFLLGFKVTLLRMTPLLDKVIFLGRFDRHGKIIPLTFSYDDAVKLITLPYWRKGKYRYPNFRGISREMKKHELQIYTEICQHSETRPYSITQPQVGFLRYTPSLREVSWNPSHEEFVISNTGSYRRFIRNLYQVPLAMESDLTPRLRVVDKVSEWCSTPKKVRGPKWKGHRTSVTELDLTSST